MCGIICELLYSGRSSVDNKLLKITNNRGPDCSQQIVTHIKDIHITFSGSVLWMRGSELVAQPVENESGILLFNGDIYNDDWNQSQCDTLTLMDKLSKYQDSADILSELRLLKGPFSIIYFNKHSKELYFTRDGIGRNSLLFHRSEGKVLIASVLGRRFSCIELPASHIYKLNIVTDEITQYPWEADVKEDIYSIDDWLRSLETQQMLPDEDFVFEFNGTEDLVGDEVAKYIENTAKEYKSKISFMRKLLHHPVIRDVVYEITRLLESSVKTRLDAQPRRCKDCINKTENCNHCTVGILFSGGLDCTILAFLANKYLQKNQSIDLLNVAFKKDDNATYEVPDRITGRQSFEVLKTLCPERKWEFREINVPKDELEECQISTIADLVHPRQTILDESLGSALWFAARGKDDTCVSSSRVLLLGSGADELFGGYTRHRNAFRRQGWTGLDRELQLDWRRISFRNLARDNRVISDHGRQPRMPYLDEDLTDYVLKLKPWLKCFPSDTLSQGAGDKLILRLVALSLGLTDVVTLPKRALQFGSRIANKKEKGSDVSKRFITNTIND